MREIPKKEQQIETMTKTAAQKAKEAKEKKKAIAAEEAKTIAAAERKRQDKLDAAISNAFEEEKVSVRIAVVLHCQRCCRLTLSRVAFRSDHQLQPHRPGPGRSRQR